MSYHRFFKWAALLSFIVLVTAGCGLFGPEEEAKPIDPPQVEYSLDRQGNTDVTMTSTETANANLKGLTLYFKDENGLVTPVTVQVPMPKTKELARTTLEYMVDGGPGSIDIPAGFTALLPKGTQVRGINIIKEEKQAIVDFSKEFNNYNAQDEKKILEAVTWALTEFDSIDKVKLMVEGRELKEMPQNGTPLDEPLSRANGINIEWAEGADIGQTMPVTLFFRGMNSREDFEYYVPVTRLVPMNQDVAQATLNALIQGPSENSGLEPELLPTTKVLDVSASDDTITADFNDAILNPDQTLSSAAVQSIILSLTETTGLDNVQIKVEGKLNKTEQGQGQPVMNPVSSAKVGF